MMKNGRVMKRWLLPVAAVFVMFGLFACSKKAPAPVSEDAEQQVAPSEVAEVAVEAVAVQAEEPLDRKAHELPEDLQSGATHAAAQKPAKDDRVPIRLSALMDMGNVVVAGLVDIEGGGEAMVQEGNVFRGYTVKTIDLQGRTVTLERNGQLFTIKQVADPHAVASSMNQPPSLPPAGQTNIPPVLAQPDLRNIPTEHFEPTEDERARGIDPNDHTTWPKGYKGPAIERFLSKMSPEERAASERPLITPETRMGPALEPTEEEAVRGIDPNDHTTWPPDYKGPAIEDYLAAHPEEAAKLEAAQSNPASAPMLEGYESTPEEAARGIDPNDPATWPPDYRGPAIEDAMKEMDAKQQALPME